MTSFKTIILLIIFFVPSLYGQDGIDILCNRPFYVSGDKIGITLHQKEDQRPQVFYVELLNREGKVLDYTACKSNGITASGILDVPLSLKSDWYVIRAYGIWMPDLLFKDMTYYPVVIYDDFEEITGKSEFLTESVSEQKVADAEWSVSSKFLQRGDLAKISVGIESVTEKTRFSVNVIDQELFTLFEPFNKFRPIVRITEVTPDKEGFVPLDKLLYLGRVEGPTENILNTLYIKETKVNNWVSINENKVFGIELDAFDGTVHGQILGIEPLGRIIHYNTNLVHFTDNLALPNIDWPELPWNDRIKSYLDGSRSRKIIYDIMELYKPDIVKEKMTTEYFQGAQRQYKPEEYIRFPSIEDFFYEVVTFAKLDRNKERCSIRIRLEKNVLAPHESLVLLNGYIVRDCAEILDLDIDEIDRIDLFRKSDVLEEQFGALGKNGVIAVYTKDLSIQPASDSHISLTGFRSENSINIVDRQPNKPLFSSMLLWDPEVAADESGIITFSIPISDDRGNYIIVLDRYETNSQKRYTQSIELNRLTRNMR